MWIEEAVYALWSGDRDAVRAAFRHYTPGDQDEVIAFVLTAVLRREFRDYTPSFATFEKISDLTVRAYDDMFTVSPLFLSQIMWDLWYGDNRSEDAEVDVRVKAYQQTMVFARIMRAHNNKAAGVHYLVDTGVQYVKMTTGNTWIVG